jgi:hypothetical protein
LRFAFRLAFGSRLRWVQCTPGNGIAECLPTCG